MAPSGAISIAPFYPVYYNPAMKRWFLAFLICLSFTDAKIQTLYNSLNPRSIPQHLAFYQLYPATPQGQESLQKAWWLLTGTRQQQTPPELFASLSPAVDSIIGLITKQPYAETPSLTDRQLQIIDEAGSRLANRRLEGFRAKSEADVIKLPSDQVDLARGLFLSELGNTGDAHYKMRSYEAMIDLMALQILSSLPHNATSRDKISAINHFIFEEMGFRFPPHSLYSEDIDLYTFLPAVLDSRRGVCLGVSILYLCIAQRINLSLEIITPPGHIYVRYNDGDEIINIETTARGVNYDSDVYLGVDTRSLQQRTMKEVVGLAHMNNAARFWHQKDYAKVCECYEKGFPYLGHDPFIKELMGFAYLLSGKTEEGDTLLREIAGKMQDHEVSKDTMVEDYLMGNVDAEGIQKIFIHVDEKRESVLEKQKALKETLVKYPKFRDGVFALATTWLQLHRTKEALQILQQHHEIDPENPSSQYYMSVIYAMRTDYNRAWEHLENAEALTKRRDHYPKALKELRRELHLTSPQPNLL
jgi:regulator of sirC expression with transglutaminase-like and TPR domain